MGLLLQAVDVAGPLRWRWLLTDEETGNPLADHEVDLESAPGEVARFQDLYGYARSYAAPDRRVADESRIVADAGAWAGRVLLGEGVAAAIAAAAPVTVGVTVPPTAEPLLRWPLELAHAHGEPLAARGDVTFVYDIGGAGGRKAAVGETLRMLAVFSQPTKTSVLALRRERYALTRLIRRIAVRERAAVELRVAQYGVTRKRLAEIADDGDGWDVVHLSGHGAGGVFALEKEDGSPDLVSAGDLVRLLRPVRRRVKLAVVSACESAADTTAETLRLIGLTEQAEAMEAEVGEQGATQIPGLARELVRELDCAVVAMRHPVTDEFAIAFGDVFYDHLLKRQQPVDVAVARALAQAAGSVPSAARPAVSIATPGVFGARASGLTLAVPRGRPDMDPAERRLAYFPDEPERFVGRAAAMAHASVALASGSGRTAMLLYGMAGAGKTACALELAYRHADAFAAAAFWQAPTRDEEWASALPGLASALDIQLGDYGFTMASHIGTADALNKFLPRLRQVMKDSGVLLVLDNLETLLTPDGTWRDPRWGQLMSALTDHDGESRLILTSRIAPLGLDTRLDTGLGTGAPGGLPRAVTLPVHALSLEEAAALARELPNLRGLLHADAGPVRSPAVTEADRGRVLRVLRVVQGHPKLMELADAAATDRGRLDAQLTAVEAAADRQELDAFFRDGASALDPDQFLDTLSAWAAMALAALPEPARLMAQFLACLEDGDRHSEIVEATWPVLWRRLKRPGDPPAPGPLLDTLAGAALAEANRSPVTGIAAEAAPPETYGMHPAVATAVAATAAHGFRARVDRLLGSFWQAIAYREISREDSENSSLLVWAGLAAAPYLLRAVEWDAAGLLLERALNRDRSPAVSQMVLPGLRRIAEATGRPKFTGPLARAMWTVDPGEAERLAREGLRRAVADRDYEEASLISGDLAALLRRAGRFSEALTMIEQSAGYVRQTRLGPWTRLSAPAHRLQILADMGHYKQVLAEGAALRHQMARIPVDSREDETFDPSSIRTLVMDAMHTSALRLGYWKRCLRLNAAILEGDRRRRAGAHEIARVRLNDAGPLIELGRLDEAGRLLVECQQVAEDHGDTAMLATVLSSRAGLEMRMARPQVALDLYRAALRFFHTGPEADKIAAGHINLAEALEQVGGDRAERWAHLVAVALICDLVGIPNLSRLALCQLGEMRAEGPDEHLPCTLTEVIKVAEQTDAVPLGEFLTTVQPDRVVLEDALVQILSAAAAP